MNSSFFEIGGEIVECHVSTSIPSSSYSPSSFRGAPTTPTVAQVQAQRKHKVAGGRKGEQPIVSDSMMKMIGTGMIRTGVAILMVLDPLPFVDEIAAGALIGVGATLVYLSEN